jgi:hypothetical protein
LTFCRELTQADLIAFKVSRKSKNFYYLMPGQGRNARRRHLRNLMVALFVGLILSGTMAWVIWYFWRY